MWFDAICCFTIFEFLKPFCNPFVFHDPCIFCLFRVDIRDVRLKISKIELCFVDFEHVLQNLENHVVKKMNVHHLLRIFVAK
jgi:hypothetical protein